MKQRKTFKMELPLMTAVEQYATNYCIAKVHELYPHGSLETEELNELRCMVFDTMFMQIMDNLKVGLRLPNWVSLQIPLVPQTHLTLEAEHD